MKALTLLIICTFVPFDLHSQLLSEANLKVALSEYSKSLRSEDFNKRYEAAKQLRQYKLHELGPDIVNEVISLYETEMKKKKLFNMYAERPGKLEDKVPNELLYLNSEEFAQYKGFLSEILAKTEDPTAMRLLIDHYLDERLIINFGAAAIDPVLNVLKRSQGLMRRASALMTLSYFLQEKAEGFTAQARDRDKILAAILDTAVSDPEFILRVEAAKALGKSGDASCLKALESIAKNDPYHFTTKAILGVDEGAQPGQEVTRYPVRIAARKAIEDIKTRNKING